MACFCSSYYTFLMLPALFIYQMMAFNNILRSQCKSSAVFKHIGSDLICNGSVLKNITTNTSDSCLQECIYSGSCQAVNKKKVSSTTYDCRLLSVDSGSSVASFSRSLGWSYYEARPIDDRVGPFCRNLQSNPCSPCRCFDECHGNFTCRCDNVLNITIHSGGGEFRNFPCGEACYNASIVVSGFQPKCGAVLNITIYSGGGEFQNFPCGEACYDASIVVNGKNVSVNRRGFNLVVVNHLNGEVEDSKNFDTHDSVDQSREMTKMLQLVRMLPHRILLGAINDEGSKNFQVETDAELEGLLGMHVEVKYRSPMVFIGYSNADKPDFVMRVVEEASKLETTHHAVIPLLLQRPKIP